MSVEIPPELVSDILAGRCIAFVGSGFSGAAKLPGWPALLRELSDRSGDNELKRYIEAKLKEATPDAFEEAAQVLEQRLTRAGFIAHLKTKLATPAMNDAMQQRLDWINGMPFRAIITTNFDGVLKGRTSQFATVLRTARENWSGAYYRGRPSPVLKIHGDLEHEAENTVVFTRLDYRRRLHSDSSYVNFLRAVFLNYTILYLGCSFTDAYLNELRSESLAVIGDAPVPIAYAVINDVHPLAREHYKRNEGVVILSYDTHGGKDYTGFDEILRAIHDAANPVVRLGRSLRGRRILWVDPNPANNAEVAHEFLQRAVRAAGAGACSIDEVSTAAQGLERLKAGTYDLVISHWGEKQRTAVRLLEGMRRADLRVPALIFGFRRDVVERKQAVTGLGAQGYYFTEEGLVRGIERVVDPAQESG